MLGHGRWMSRDPIVQILLFTPASVSLVAGLSFSPASVSSVRRAPFSFSPGFSLVIRVVLSWANRFSGFLVAPLELISLYEELILFRAVVFLR